MRSLAYSRGKRRYSRMWKLAASGRRQGSRTRRRRASSLPRSLKFPCAIQSARCLPRRQVERTQGAEKEFVGEILFVLLTRIWGTGVVFVFFELCKSYSDDLTLAMCKQIRLITNECLHSNL